MSISLSRETIRLVMLSQRMIKKEFGVRIQLDDDQVMARVFAYAAQSSSGELKDCANELMQQLLPGQQDSGQQDVLEKSAAATRIYRGQVIAVETVADDSADASKPEPASRKNVIYRGQRVS